MLLAFWVLFGCQSDAKEIPPNTLPAKKTPASAPTEKKTTPNPTTQSTALSPERALWVLYPEAADEKTRSAELSACKDGDERAQISCLIARRYPTKADGDLAVRLYQAVGIVAGVEVAHTREVGYRGTIEFVPELPVGKYKQHLSWVVESMEDIDAFLTMITEKAGKDLPYRWTDLELKFYRTVKRKTPNAYASTWYFAYNVEGSMFKSLPIVRETLFHEIFHMNDQEHTDWSYKNLDEIYQSIVTRCSKPKEKLPDTNCLTPYSPGTTKVKGGTYYSFQPGNDVAEYAAELALRYYQEQRAHWKEDKKKPKPFKCTKEENAKAWKLLVDEFFLGVDLVPACP